MLASTPADFEVLVLFCFEAAAFSWTMIVMMSPTARARLSANMFFEASSFHSDPGPACASGADSNTRHAPSREVSRAMRRNPSGTANGN